MTSRTSASPASPPAPRARVRRDGWTIDRQVRFIRALFAHHSVTRAALAAGMSRESAYRLRSRPGHRDFARAWDQAVAAKGHKLRGEGHGAGAKISAGYPRKGHGSHGAGQFAPHGQPGQLRDDCASDRTGRK